MATAPTRTGYKSLPREFANIDVYHVVNQAMQGKINCVGSITLNTSGTTTVINDTRITEESVVLFTPTDAGGATESASGSMYVSARSVSTLDTTASTFTITHTNTATARNFKYAILG